MNNETKSKAMKAAFSIGKTLLGLAVAAAAKAAAEMVEKKVSGGSEKKEK